MHSGPPGTAHGALLTSRPLLPRRPGGSAHAADRTSCRVSRLLRVRAGPTVALVPARLGLTLGPQKPTSPERGASVPKLGVTGLRRPAAPCRSGARRRWTSAGQSEGSAEMPRALSRTGGARGMCLPGVRSQGDASSGGLWQLLGQVVASGRGQRCVSGCEWTVPPIGAGWHQTQRNPSNASHPPGPGLRPHPLQMAEQGTLQPSTRLARSTESFRPASHRGLLGLKS